ncbi:MAG: HAD-IA family hydrolase [Deltaproteobacteria bacterium]|nr:HAD-IA family hydrolase [Deltaproteobacteria bacterium]
MKREVELFLFDLDGTLADTGVDLANSVNYVRFKFELKPLKNQLVYTRVGRGVEYLIRSCLPETSPDRLQEAVELFLGHYENHLVDATVLYPGVRETLEYFKLKRKIVVSNKLHRLSVGVLRGLGIELLFDAILGGDSAAQRKPDPEPLNLVLKTFGVSPLKAVMVGDGGIDIEAGRKAGVYTCGVTYGLGDRGELVASKPDLLIDRIDELIDHFL